MHEKTTPQTPILANCLYLPHAPPLDDFVHVWNEKVYEPVVDEEGTPELTPTGRQKVRRKTVTHTIEAYREILAPGSSWVGLPRGDLKLISPYLEGAVDLRARTPLGFHLQIGNHVLQDPRWPDQKRCVEAWLKAGSGIIQGTTGAGKTVMGIAGCAALGLQTLILSKRGEGEGHWEEEFREHTNIDELEHQEGRRLIGPYRHKKEYPISIGTIQMFLHEKGYRRLIKDQYRFGLVIPDEIHELVAPKYVRLLGLWSPLYWLGLTATPKRPDHREFLAYRIVGPIAAKLKADQMRPEVTFIETAFEVPAWMKKKAYPRQWTWGKLLDLMSTDEDRINLIVEHVMQDIDDGRLTAVIGERNKIVLAVFDKLKDNGYDVALAIGSTPKARRKEIYADVARGVKYRCLCAGKVLDAMVSIKPLDCLHLITPVSGETRVYQIFGRTRRPKGGKPTPLVRYYQDNGGQLYGAYRNVLKVCEGEGWKIYQEEAAKPQMGKWKK